jgi:hypothetical protein
MIGFRVVEIDFDSDGVQKDIDRGGKRALRIIGFETRAEAQSIIQPAAGSSAPGQPPHSKTGALKRFIRYGLDGSKCVVIGAQLLELRSQDAATALERGGVSMSVKGQSQYVAKRPFMLPSFKAELPKVPAIFEDLFR